MNKGRGRPAKGTSRARGDILDAATHLFLANGYERTTLRMIAAEAECDVALISYHFGPKRALFAQVMALALSPAHVLEAALPGDPLRLPERLVAHILEAWEHPDGGPRIAQVVQMATAQPEVFRLFREYVQQEVAGRLVEYFGGPGATERAAATLTVVIGIIFSRYIMAIEPAANLPTAAYSRAVVPLMAAAIQPARATRPRLRR